VSTKEQRACDWTNVVSRGVRGLFTAAAFYVLSYGPVQRLTSNVAYGNRYDGTRGFRAAPCPALAEATDVIYHPLFAVELGKAGRLPQRVICWYVDLWVYPRHV
jgi:hypothetical protein